MSPDPGPPVSQPTGAAQTRVPRRRRWLLWGCGGFLAFVLIIIATVAITVWWIQRPIKPVVLSAVEKKAVEDKLAHLNATPTNRPAATSAQDAVSNAADNRRYVPGSRELRLTERELNGLLNENTDLGRTVRLELDTDAINAYIAVPIPRDFPVGGGRTFRARGRFRVSLTKDQAPVAMLEDVTVFGLSLPKAWLGGIKGKNLLADAVGKRNGSSKIRGIKGLRVVPGALVLEVED